MELEVQESYLLGETPGRDKGEGRIWQREASDPAACLIPVKKRGGRMIWLEQPKTPVLLPECLGEAGGLLKTKDVHWRSAELGRNGLSPIPSLYAAVGRGTAKEGCEC